MEKILFVEGKGEELWSSGKQLGKGKRKSQIAEPLRESLPVRAE